MSNTKPAEDGQLYELTIAFQPRVGNIATAVAFSYNTGPGTHAECLDMARKMVVYLNKFHHENHTGLSFKGSLQFNKEGQTIVEVMKHNALLRYKQDGLYLVFKLVQVRV